VWNYITRFTKFNGYKHRVLTTYKGKVYSMPINLGTINAYYQKQFSPTEAKSFIDSEIARDKVENPSNLEERAISLIGKPLYEAFVAGYTAKQWETDPKELPAGIITRLPVRFNYNDRYFNDLYEGIPVEGYTKIFERMLTHPLIDVRLKTDFFDVRKDFPRDLLVIYTGPLDRYFDYKHGELGWRTIDSKREVHEVSDYQGTSQMNYADRDVAYTRINEYKHFHPESEEILGSAKTLVFKEYSRFAGRDDDPYYPINTPKDQEIFRKYQEEARRETHVHFGGRLGAYKYFDMHQVIGAALNAYEKDIKPRFS
jgi:UDP-galactopyranose mutase